MFDKTVYIFSDGACSGNPGPGGYGAILRCGDREKEISGGEAHTTNNRMELCGVIAGLEALKKPCRVICPVTAFSILLFSRRIISHFLRFVKNFSAKILPHQTFDRLPKTFKPSEKGLFKRIY